MNIIVINTQSINHKNATGITMRSLFDGLRSDNNITEFYMQPCNKAQDPLNIESVRLGFSVCPLRTLANKIYSKGEGNPSSSTVANPQKGKSLKSKFIGLLFAALDCEPVFLTRKFKKNLKSLSPDCVYTMGNAVDAIKLAYKVSKYLDVPIVPHFMDNWQESHRYGKDKYPIHLKKTQKYLKKMYTRTKAALVISDKMGKEYTKKWNIPHYAMMNSIVVNDFACNKKDNLPRNFVYAGGLHLNRYISLIDIAKAFESINNEKNDTYSLKIYTDDKSKKLYSDNFKDFRCVTFHDYVPHEKIKEIYEDSDALVHIESFDDSQRDFIRFSLSTKISEYLATGRPILLYAPDDVYISQYLSEENAAVVISSPDDIPTALDKLNDTAILSLISTNSKEVANKNHDISGTQKLARKVFAISVEKDTKASV